MRGRLFLFSVWVRTLCLRFHHHILDGLGARAIDVSGVEHPQSRPDPGSVSAVGRGGIIHYTSSITKY